MFKGVEEFKFYIYQHNVFTLEKLMKDNNIEFYNEKIFGTNVRSFKYYIKNTDRKKLDNICSKNKIEVFIDSLPNIETRFPDLKISYLGFIFFIIILFLIIFLIK